MEVRDENSIKTTERGKRIWMYPKKPKGKLYNFRTFVSIVLLIALFVLPFVKTDGHPLMLFNILDRKFILFGILFGPQDFYLFVLAMIAVLVFIILFTVIFGRVFCGWTCPQTVFLEMVFRKIEYWIEGNPSKQKSLANTSWTGKKMFKKGLKHSVFFGISFLIANTFLAYIIGIDELYKIVTVPPTEHLTGFIAITFFSLAFYTVFAFIREYVCIFACPYGRLQGVLLDKNSIVIAYDHLRGEPRGYLKRTEQRNLGDCINCKQCVDVCPTGIDIRNGTQLECINCSACIDACNEIMDKVGFQRGLIRYASEKEISENSGFKITARMIGYTSVLLVIVIVFSILFTTRSDISANVLRTPGMFYQEQPGEKISNVYNLKVVNKSFDWKFIELKTYEPETEIQILGGDINLAPQEVREVKILIIKKASLQTEYNSPTEIIVYSNGKKIKEIETSFMSPIKK